MEGSLSWDDWKNILECWDRSTCWSDSALCTYVESAGLCSPSVCYTAPRTSLFIPFLAPSGKGHRVDSILCVITTVAWSSRCLGHNTGNRLDFAF